MRLLADADADVNFTDRWGVTPLAEAVKHRQTAVVAELLARGAISALTDDGGRCALRHAVDVGSDDCVALLVESGAKLGGGGGTAATLCELAERGNTAALRRWLVAGAEADACDYDKRTALHLAAAEGRAGIVALLVDHGATCGFADRWGRTAIDEARANGHTDIVEFFMQKVVIERAARGGAGGSGGGGRGGGGRRLSV